MGDTMTFEQMNLDKNIIQALHTLGYEKPLPVQEKVIPNILLGTDCIVKSRTGSGKTASFAIPIIQNLEIDERSPQALVLTPTRELALQIQQNFQFPSKRSQVGLAHPLNIGSFQNLFSHAILEYSIWDDLSILFC